VRVSNVSELTRKCRWYLSESFAFRRELKRVASDCTTDINLAYECSAAHGMFILPHGSPAQHVHNNDL
jgi:hypothetical protein